MTKYIVIGASVNFASGILALTKEQAASRSHALESLKDGLYLIKSSVQFKHGEVIGYDGEVNKAILEEIEECGKKKKAVSEKKEDKALTTEALNRAEVAEKKVVELEEKLLEATSKLDEANAELEALRVDLAAHIEEAHPALITEDKSKKDTGGKEEKKEKA